MQSVKTREQRARRKLSKDGLILRKSRVRNWHGDDFGGYMIIEARYNYIVAGEKFNLDLEDVERYADE